MRKLAISLISCFVSSTAWCVCSVPQPRLVCAEYSQSKAVVIAKLIGSTSDSEDYPSYFIYRFAIVRRLRGQVPQTFDLYEGNDSGRASFEWKVNEQYLLFLIQPEPSTRNQWLIDGCGNSAPLIKASSVLTKIQAISREQKKGVISGMVGTDSWTTGVPGAVVKISGSDYDSETKTNAKGRFIQKVPVGIYTVTAAKDGTPISAEPFSYENPARVVIAPGGCAQVQFTDSNYWSK